MSKLNKNAAIPVLSAICAAAICLMIFALTRNKAQPAVFLPPDFEENAVSGFPEDAGESWTKVYQDGMSFTAYVCGEVVINDGTADLYFTSGAENEVWIKLRIMNESGEILAETGLLKPGEYVKSVEFDIAPSKGEKISMKIMAYEPETYYSAGAVTLNTSVGG